MTLKTLDSSILSLIILICIYINAFNRSEKVFIHYKLFISLVQANMALLVIDILGWVFNGLPGSLNMVSNQGFNLLLYITEPLPAMLWVLYTDYQVYRDENRLRIVKRFLMVLLTINAAVSVISLFTGWYFSVDAQNIYHRGKYFGVHVAFCYSLLVYTFFFIINSRNLLEKRYYYSLLLFFLPLSVGTIMQTLYYGVSYNWTGMDKVQ